MRSGARKALNGVTVATVLALALAACGGDDEDDGGSGGDGGAAAPDENGEYSGELTVWIMGDKAEPVGVATDEAKAAFEAEHPDVTVNVEYVPWEAGKDHFTNAIVAGELPDLAESGVTWTPEFAEEGVLAEVDLGDTEYVPVLEETGTFDGATYGYPWYGGSRVLLYRTDIFEKVGVEPPETWDDLIKVGDKIAAETDMSPFQIAANNQHYFLPLVWQAGGEIATQDGDTWTPGFNTDEGQAALEYIDTLWKKGWSPPDAETDEFNSISLADQFTNEKAAMVVALPWQVTGMVESNPKLEGKIGAVLLPEGPGGNRDTLAGGSHLVVFEDSEQKELAAAFAEFMVSPDQLVKFAETTGFFPGTVAETEAVVDQNDWLAPVAAEQFVEHARAYPVAGWWGALEGATAVKDVLQQLVGGDFTPDEAAAKLDEEVQSRIDK